MVKVEERKLLHRIQRVATALAGREELPDDGES